MRNVFSCLLLFVVVMALMPPALAQTGSIYANPNPCPIPSGQTQCTTTITWSSQGTSVVEIWVSWPNGGSPSLFASSGGGGPYTQNASWIQANGTYVFTLYDYSSGSQGANLGSVSVTGVPTISASPNPCSIPSGQTQCTTAITWSSQGTSSVEIFVSVNGGSPSLFASSGGGGPYTQNAVIQANNTYVFTLYDYSSGSQGANLGSVIVTGVPAISANPNPCSIPSGQAQCTTAITWSSQGPSSVKIFVSVNAGSPSLFASSGGGGPYTQNAVIQANNTYVFTLYDYSSGSQGANLGSVSVTGVPVSCCGALTREYIRVGSTVIAIENK